MEGTKGGIEIMIKYLQKKYALSETGAKDLIKGMHCMCYAKYFFHVSRWIAL